MNSEEILAIIKRLADKRAPSGLEEERAKLFAKEINKRLSEKNIEVKKDLYGNHFIKLKGKGKKKGALAIFAHIDEIGGTIRKIQDNGSLEFSKRGGYEGRWLISKKIKILNRQGKWVTGVIKGRSAHSTPASLRKKEKLDPLEMEIFIGASSKEEVLEKYAIHVGAPFVFAGEFGLLNSEFDNNILAGYSMDNLAALTSLIVLIDMIQDKLMDDFGRIRVPYDVYFVGSTREEIGTEGAYYFAREQKISKSIAIDIGLVENASGTINCGLELNDEPVIVWQESKGYGILDYEFCKELVSIAEESGIGYQDGVFEFYGSDAGKTQKWLGISSALLGIPTMFSHNVPEISTIAGIKKTAELIFEYIKKL